MKTKNCHQHKNVATAKVKTTKSPTQKFGYRESPAWTFQTHTHTLTPHKNGVDHKKSIAETFITVNCECHLFCPCPFIVFFCYAFCGANRVNISTFDSTISKSSKTFSHFFFYVGCMTIKLDTCAEA